jgi:hypothetical protein
MENDKAHILRGIIISRRVNASVTRICGELNELGLPYRICEDVYQAAVECNQAENAVEIFTIGHIDDLLLAGVSFLEMCWQKKIKCICLAPDSAHSSCNCHKAVVAKTEGASVVKNLDQAQRKIQQLASEMNTVQEFTFRTRDLAQIRVSQAELNALLAI